jgi:hypothetical protein
MPHPYTCPPLGHSVIRTFRAASHVHIPLACSRTNIEKTSSQENTDGFGQPFTHLIIVEAFYFIYATKHEELVVIWSPRVADPSVVAIPP